MNELKYLENENFIILKTENADGHANEISMRKI